MIGLVIASFVLYVFFALWLLVSIILKLLGPKCVGVFSGRIVHLEEPTKPIQRRSSTRRSDTDERRRKLDPKNESLRLTEVPSQEESSSEQPKELQILSLESTTDEGLQPVKKDNGNDTHEDGVNGESYGHNNNTLGLGLGFENKISCQNRMSRCYYSCCNRQNNQVDESSPLEECSDH